MTPTGSKKEKPIIDPKVVAASEYVMKNDSVIAEWGKTNPSHFIRLVEDLVEWHNSELTQALKELKEEVIGEVPSKMNTDNWKCDRRVAELKLWQHQAIDQKLKALEEK